MAGGYSSAPYTSAFLDENGRVSWPWIKWFDTSFRETTTNTGMVSQLDLDSGIDANAGRFERALAEVSLQVALAGGGQPGRNDALIAELATRIEGIREYSGQLVADVADLQTRMGLVTDGQPGRFAGDIAELFARVGLLSESLGAQAPTPQIYPLTLTTVAGAVSPLAAAPASIMDGATIAAPIAGRYRIDGGAQISVVGAGDALQIFQFGARVQPAGSSSWGGFSPGMTFAGPVSAQGYVSWNWVYVAGVGDTFDLTGMKAAGTGTSTAAGNLTATWISPN